MSKNPRRGTTTYGFKRTSGLLQDRIRSGSESRGFAVSRLLTHWAEIVGPETASMARPVEVSYGRAGLGATLALLTTGARAPMLEMEKEKIREKVNACYGYNAIAKIRITQTAPIGFAEGQAAFAQAPKAKPPGPSKQTSQMAAKAAGNVTDPQLRDALAALGANIFHRRKPCREE